MSARKVTCPRCKHVLVPPAATPRKRRTDTRTDEELYAGYAVLREFNLRRFGVPYTPTSERTLDSHLTSCIDCHGWTSASVYGRCYPCYHKHEATRCIYCNQPSQNRDEAGICNGCQQTIREKSPHWIEVAEINARGAA